MIGSDLSVKYLPKLNLPPNAILMTSPPSSPLKVFKSFIDTRRSPYTLSHSCIHNFAIFSGSLNFSTVDIKIPWNTPVICLMLNS